MYVALTTSAVLVFGLIDALTNLVKDLLMYARPPLPKPMPVEISALVESTASLLANDPALGRVKVDVVGSAAPVHADPGLLQIAFTNLLVNAAQAMKGEGAITVAVGETGSRCSIAFIDQGPGIPTSVQQKVFTPFFTTKSRGTGLGLPTARRLIEAHSGRVSLDCPLGGGTTITVDLPLRS